MTRVRERRKQRGLSLLELALRSGVAPSTLSLVERGKRCTQETASRIAAVLNTEPRTLWPDFDTLRRDR